MSYKRKLYWIFNKKKPSVFAINKENTKYFSLILSCEQSDSDNDLTSEVLYYIKINYFKYFINNLPNSFCHREIAYRIDLNYFDYYSEILINKMLKFKISDQLIYKRYCEVNSILNKRYEKSK